MFYEQAYPDENVRIRKWKSIAERLGIEIVDDAVLAEQRKQRELAKVHAEFLTD